MPTYLEIAVNIPQVSGLFDYHLPVELDGQVAAGHLVEVPFGKQTVQGVVTRLLSAPSVPETRPVHSLIDSQVALTPVQIQLAHILADMTLSPLSVCVGLMIPPGLNQQADSLYTLTGGKPGEEISTKGASLEKRLFQLLRQRGPLRGRQIDQALPRSNWRPIVQKLVRRGVLRSESILLPPAIRPKQVRTAQLACPPEKALAAMPELGARQQTLARRQGILRYLMREPGPVNVTWLFAESGGNLSDLRKLEEMGLIHLSEDEIWRDPLADLDFIPSHALQLTTDQQRVFQEIQPALRSDTPGQGGAVFLLHGVTGSGKTEIYLQSVTEVLRQGKQAIILVPEIAMTPQTVRRFVARFPGQVGLVHSRLSTGERYDTWRRARQGEISILVGARSALFSPLPRPGLIVVDECHDSSYWQSDIQPYYHAVHVARQYAYLLGAVCILGSATPQIDDRFLAEQGQIRYLHLPARILAHRESVARQLERLAASKPAGTTRPQSRYQPQDKETEGSEVEGVDLPPVQIIDMRQELKAGNRSIFSRALQNTLEQILQEGEQAILFLNRRGTATYIFCRDCGYTLKCPRCDIPLTLHTDVRSTTCAQGSQDSQLICHHCGYTRGLPKHCPQCRSQRIRQYGAGVEKVEAEIQEKFPQARLLRWDYDTTRHKGAHDLILDHFSRHQADILIGTQMIAKGLDLPLVTLVGVVLADVGLNLPDYRAAERTFQVLTQVAGRAGRSPLGGQVVLQTFQPDHYVIQAAAHHDYQAFYRQELANRRNLGYPPFSQLVRLEYRHTDPEQAQKAAQKLAGQIQEWLIQEQRQATELIGPVPCFFKRIAGKSRWQIVLRGPNPLQVLRGRNLGDWRIEIDPISLL